MSNFSFMSEWPALQAENLVQADPRAACFYARFAMERVVRALPKPGFSLQGAQP